jgi:Fe-Mn family superoxide dismutase
MYQTKTFTIPTMEGISERTITEHLGLYAGYVKHVNHIHDEMKNVTDGYAKAEMQRRLGFEFGGMRNHEYYFTQFQGGAMEIPESPFKGMVEKQFGSTDDFIAHVRNIAMTRGVGWAMVYIDRQTDQLVCTWVDEQHLGQLADLDMVLAIDMWEHAYMLDYAPSEKKQYVDAVFANLNWEVVANRI